MAERIVKVSDARRVFDEQVQRLYQARLILSAIEGGGAMSPTQKEIQAANRVISQTTDENIRLAASVRIDIAHGVDNGNAWRVKYPK